MAAAEMWVLGLLAVGLTFLVAVLRSPSLRERLLVQGTPMSTFLTGSDLLVVLGFVLIAMGALETLLYVLKANTGEAAWSQAPLQRLILGISPTVSAVAVISVLARLRDRTPEEAFGLASPEPTKDMGRGLLLYIAAYPVVLGAIVLWTQLFREMGVQVPPQEAARLVLARRPWPELAASVAVAVLVAPLLEEMVFRGFLLPVVARRAGSPAAVLLTALLFGLLHGGFFAGPVFALGLLLGWVYWRTGRLWVAVGCHSAHNAVSLVTAWLAWGLT